MHPDKNSYSNDHRFSICLPVDTEAHACSGGQLLHTACLVLCVHGSDMEDAEHGYGLKEYGPCRMEV